VMKKNLNVSLFVHRWQGQGELLLRCMTGCIKGCGLHFVTKFSGAQWQGQGQGQWSWYPMNN
jgi:hypothetical protein